MAQVFPRIANSIARLSVLFLVASVCLIAWGGALIVRSDYETTRNIAHDQPVPFSHQHHVAGLGIDCRYCHTSVESSSFANIPPTKTCMNCHSQIWAVAPVLQPVRRSYQTDRSIRWIRVHDLPQFVYFNHQIHVNKGMGCSTCHGRVDTMPLTWQAQDLTMGWCLNCHRHPASYVRPQSQVFNMAYAEPANQAAMGERLVRQYHIESLTSCSTCHR